MAKHDKNDPTVNELRERFRYESIIKLGRLALWNCLTKKVVDLKAPTIGLIEKYSPEMFQKTINSPLPVFLRE
jgi:hypothetical protein